MANLNSTQINGSLKVTDTIYGNLSGNASTANKLGTNTVGGSARPIYLADGTPTACTLPSEPNLYNFDNKFVLSNNNQLRVTPGLSFYSDSSNGDLFFLGGPSGRQGHLRIYSSSTSLFQELTMNSVATSSLESKLPTGGGNLLAVSRTNEINMDIDDSSNTLWFNYLGKNATARTTAIEHYYFCRGNGQQATSNAATTIHSGSYKMAEKATMTYNSSTDSIDFTF